MAENPEKAFRGNGNKYKNQARIAELERLLGQTHAEIELLKKSLRQGSEEDPRGETETDIVGRYMIIQDAQSNDLILLISRSCQALEISRCGYYEWLKPFEEVSSENGEYLDLVDQIQEISSEFTCYGYMWITTEIKNRGYAVNHKRVLRIMHQERLLCHKNMFKLATTDSIHGLPTYPNLLKGREITRVNQVWASDITYVQL